MANTRGTITFVFDDGYERVYQNVIPALNRHNMSGVFALPINGEKLQKSEQRTIRPWKQWMQVTEQGHELASHSINHPNLTKLTTDALDTELRESATLLGASTLVYPGGALDENVVTTARKYYTAARTVHYGFEQIPPREPMRLRSYNFSRNNFSVLKANLLAVWAYITDSWLIETYHMVDDEDTEMVHSVRTMDFQKHLAFVARMPIQVKTIRDVMNPS